MRIFLTGGTGFIGQTLLRDYAEENEFTVITSKPNSAGLFHHKNINYIPFPYPQTGDLVKQSGYKLREYLHNIDAVALLGFARTNARSKAEHLNDYIPSLLLIESIFDAMESENVDNAVLVSSCAVYSKQCPFPHKESERIEPISVYGAAKAFAENMGRLRQLSGGMRVKSLRVAQVLGWGETRGVVHTFLERLQTDEPLSIWGSGKEIKREYIYVRDVASAIICAARHSDLYGEYNVGTGEALDVLSIAGCLVDRWQKGAKIEVHPDQKVEEVTYCMDCFKICKEMNWKAKWTIQDALSEMIADSDRRY